MRHKSSASWAVGVVAPWCLGVGLLVSFTASAGQDPAGSLRKAPFTARVEASVEGASLASALNGEVPPPLAAPLQLARLDVGGPHDLHAATDEREPHDELKPNATGVPEVDRSHKGDPLVATLRPSYESRRAGQAKKVEASAPSEEPQITTQRTASAALPLQAGSTATPAAAAASPQVLKERALHGATPAIPRAVALGSSTPSQPDAVPIEVASFPHITLGPMAAVAPGQRPRPDYVSLIDPEKMSSEKRCLAEAVYFEARSEPVEGQAAVAQVVLNRVSSGLYPPSICGVVYQGRRHYMGCQFSFACEGKSLRITEAESWSTAVRVADEVLAGQTYLSQVGRSTHYHADYVRPYWARTLTRMEKIGHHVFYKIKGQS